MFVKYENMKIQSASKRLSAVVKIGVSRQVAIPKKLHDQLGLAPGDYLQMELDGDRLVLTPQAMIEKRLAEGLADIRKGRVHGPFATVPELLKSIRRTKRRKAS